MEHFALQPFGVGLIKITIQNMRAAQIEKEMLLTCPLRSLGLWRNGRRRGCYRGSQLHAATGVLANLALTGEWTLVTSPYWTASWNSMETSGCAQFTPSAHYKGSSQSPKHCSRSQYHSSEKEQLQNFITAPLLSHQGRPVEGRLPWALHRC